MVNKLCCILSEKWFPGHQGTSRALASRPQTSTVLLPGHYIRIFFLKLLETAGFSTSENLTTGHIGVLCNYFFILSLYFLVCITNRENLIQVGGKEAREGVHNINNVWVAQVSFSQFCICRVLSIESEPTRGHMPTLYLWAMVKSNNTNLPQVSLAGKSEKAS